MRSRDYISSRLRTLARTLHLAPRADESAAAAALGPEHELVGVLARRRALTVQMLVTAIPLTLAAVGIVRHAASAPLILGAAAAVQLGLLVAVPYSRQRVRDISEELIATGNGAARGLRIVEDEHRRLASRAEQERLAQSFERLIETALRWPRLGPGFVPPPGVTCLRRAIPEAREVVALLREGAADVRGVALTSRLLTDGGTSPLFGRDAGLLREELKRIRFLLAAPAHPVAGRLAA
jgi:hypothetical protein